MALPSRSEVTNYAAANNAPPALIYAFAKLQSRLPSSSAEITAARAGFAERATTARLTEDQAWAYVTRYGSMPDREGASIFLTAFQGRTPPVGDGYDDSSIGGGLDLSSLTKPPLVYVLAGVAALLLMGKLKL